MNATSSPLGPDFVKQMIELLTTGVAQATAHAYRMFWDIFISLLKEHWLATLIVLILVLLYAVARYFLTGRWRVLGSVLYNYFYCGILFLIGLMWGPEVYANDYFPIVATIVYIISFSIVGFILLTSGIQRPYGRR